MGNEQSPPPLTKISFAEFLLGSAVGAEAIVTDALKFTFAQALSSHSDKVNHAFPALHLLCDSELCQQRQVAEAQLICSSMKPDQVADHFWDCVFTAKYTCRNCQRAVKFFTVILCSQATKGYGVSTLLPPIATKLGEYPFTTERVGNKLRQILGSDFEVYAKGMRAEREGLGIGAYAYYRRIVEGRKNSLFEAIDKVAERENAPSEVRQSILDAKQETQFKKAMETIRVPPSLLIDGHNPMQALHSAMSEGIHAMTDQECLDYAKHIRVILVELVRRIDSALQNHEEIKSALSAVNSIPQRRQKNKGN